jgi:hypothetical protein
MELHMLVEEKLGDVPKELEVLQDFGELQVVFDATEENDRMILNGKHMALRGDDEVFVKWLKPFDGIAIGEGSPMCQQFNIHHIKQ